MVPLIAELLAVDVVGGSRELFGAAPLLLLGAFLGFALEVLLERKDAGTDLWWLRIGQAAAVCTVAVVLCIVIPWGVSFVYDRYDDVAHAAPDVDISVDAIRVGARPNDEDERRDNFGTNLGLLDWETPTVVREAEPFTVRVRVTSNGAEPVAAARVYVVLGRGIDYSARSVFLRTADRFKLGERIPDGNGQRLFSDRGLLIGTLDPGEDAALIFQATLSGRASFDHPSVVTVKVSSDEILEYEARVPVALLTR